MKKISSNKSQMVAIFRVVGFDSWKKLQQENYVKSLIAVLGCRVLVVDAEQVDVTFVELC